MNIIQLIRSLKPHRREHWIMLCILVYQLSSLLQYYLPSSICNALMSASSVGFIIVVLFHLRGNPLRDTTRGIYILLIFWSVILTLRLFLFDLDDVRATFSNYKGWTSWLTVLFGSAFLMPNLLPFLLLIFPKGYKFDFRYLWRIMWFLCIAYLCYYPFAFWNMTHFSWSFDAEIESWSEGGGYGDFIMHSTLGLVSLLPPVIMVYFKKFLRNKQWQWFLTAYIGSIIITIFLARRGGLAMSLLYLVLAWLMYSISDQKTYTIKMIFIATISVGLGYLLFTGTADSLFATIIERGAEDSRSGVEEGFLADMKTTSDWLFGRGWFGRYYEPLIGDYRNSIETGFYALILRGGLLYLIPYVLILALTMINGMFRSKNLFCKSFAIMALMQIVSLYPSGWPAFDFFFFTLWLGVWVCNERKIRGMNDIQIKEQLF